MLVYEYVDNGNLEQWLHGDVDGVSPLSWDIRMKIAIGTAKGYDFLRLYCRPVKHNSPISLPLDSQFAQNGSKII